MLVFYSYGDKNTFISDDFGLYPTHTLSISTTFTYSYIIPAFHIILKKILSNFSLESSIGFLFRTQQWQF